MVGLYAYLFRPDCKSFVVVLINGNPDVVYRQLQHLRAEFPRPRGCLVLEIIAEREVAEHFKIGAVARCFAHALDIGRADAFLAGGHPLAGRRDLPGEIFFHRRHAGIDEQEAVIVLRDEREARQAKVPLGFKKAQVFFAKFVEACPFHTQISPSKKIKMPPPPKLWDESIPRYHPNCT